MKNPQQRLTQHPPEVHVSVRTPGRLGGHNRQGDTRHREFAAALKQSKAWRQTARQTPSAAAETRTLSSQHQEGKPKSHAFGSPTFLIIMKRGPKNASNV